LFLASHSITHSSCSLIYLTQLFLYPTRDPIFFLLINFSQYYTLYPNNHRHPTKASKTLPLNIVPKRDLGILLCHKSISPKVLPQFIEVFPYLQFLDLMFGQITLVPLRYFDIQIVWKLWSPSMASPKKFQAFRNSLGKPSPVLFCLQKRFTNAF